MFASSLRLFVACLVLLLAAPAALAGHPSRALVLPSGQRHLVVLPLEDDHSGLKKHELEMLRGVLVDAAKGAFGDAVNVVDPAHGDKLAKTHGSLRRCKRDCALATGRALRAHLVLNGRVGHAFERYQLQLTLQGTWPPDKIGEVTNQVADVAELLAVTRSSAEELLRRFDRSAPAAEPDPVEDEVAASGDEGVSVGEEPPVRFGIEAATGLSIYVEDRNGEVSEEADPGAYGRLGGFLSLYRYLGVALLAELGGAGPDGMDYVDFQFALEARAQLPVGPVQVFLGFGAGLGFETYNLWAWTAQLVGLSIRGTMGVSYEVTPGIAAGLDASFSVLAASELTVCGPDLDGVFDEVCGSEPVDGVWELHRARVGVFVRYLF